MSDELKLLGNKFFLKPREESYAEVSKDGKYAIIKSVKTVIVPMEFLNSIKIAKPMDKTGDLFEWSRKNNENEAG